MLTSNLLNASQRGYMTLLEHAQVREDGGRLLFEKAENSVHKSFNIPHLNCALLMLGEGTSITQAAARILAEANTMTAFCGRGGAPLISATPVEFLPLCPDIEYGPTPYMQEWGKRFFDDNARLAAAKMLLKERFRKTKELWNKLQLAQMDSFRLVECNNFLEDIDKSTTIQELLASEGRYTKRLYGIVAAENGYCGYTREQQTAELYIPNKLLDHANYLTCGVAAAALHTLGISFAFPVLQGKTRRGGLVFDIADLVKDGICIPLAFEMAGKDDQAMQNRLVDIFAEEEILGYLIETTKQILCEK